MIGQPPKPTCAALAASLAATVSLFCAATSSPGAEGSVPVVSQKYLTHFTGLLEAGFGSSPNLEAAERHYQSARRLRPDDPRLEYAYGLVLLENLKYTDAVEHFQQAAESDTPYLPAKRAAIRELIRQQDYDVAVGELVTLAKLVGRNGDAALPVGGRIETARWIGRTMEFLAGPLDSDAVSEATVAADTEIRNVLEDSYATLYRRGRQDVRAMVHQFQQEQQAAEEAATQKHQQELADTETRIQEYANRREELLESKKERDLRSADTVGEMESKLKQLAERFETLNKSVTSLLQSIQSTQLDIERLQALSNSPVRNTSRVTNRRSRGQGLVTQLNLWDLQILARSQELNMYLAEYSNVVEQRKRTMMAARSLLAKHTAAAGRARKQRSKVTEKIEQVAQWDARLRRAMQQAAQAPVSSVRLRALASRARSFAAYEEFDLERERRRMQHAYAERAN